MSGVSVLRLNANRDPKVRRAGAEKHRENLWSLDYNNITSFDNKFICSQWTPRRCVLSIRDAEREQLALRLSANDNADGERQEARFERDGRARRVIVLGLASSCGRRRLGCLKECLHWGEGSGRDKRVCLTKQLSCTSF